jgi:uncharacterized phiE125 gp8 family phage protein
MLYPLRLDTGTIVNQFIDLDIVKKHLRVDFADDDILLDTYILAAIEWAENATDRTIFARTHTWILSDFERCASGMIRLPRGKVQAVSSIIYTAGGTQTTIYGPSSSPVGIAWQEDLRSDAGGVLVQPQGSSWPSIDFDAVEPVKINFTAGWTADKIPSSILHAIFLAVADMYDMRDSRDIGSSGISLMQRDAMISPYRLTRVY